MLKPIRIIVRILIEVVVIGVFFWLIGEFDVFATNPIKAILLLGFYIKDLLISWGIAALWGWIVCIAIEGWILFGIINLVSKLFVKTKKTMSSFK